MKIEVAYLFVQSVVPPSFTNTATSIFISPFPLFFHRFSLHFPWAFSTPFQAAAIAAYNCASRPLFPRFSCAQAYGFATIKWLLTPPNCNLISKSIMKAETSTTMQLHMKMALESRNVHDNATFKLKLLQAYYHLGFHFSI